MLILTICTDNPEAEVSLYKNDKQIDHVRWQAHRQLADTIHLMIKKVLESQNNSLEQLDGIVVFKGPGSFTGLRIGLSVANALADSLEIPVVSASGENWAKQGVTHLKTGGNEHVTLPEYGALPHITEPKH